MTQNQIYCNSNIPEEIHPFLLYFREQNKVTYNFSKLAPRKGKWCLRQVIYWYFEIFAEVLIWLRSIIDILIIKTFRHQPHHIVKHTQIICRQQSANCLRVFDHFIRLTLKVLTNFRFKNLSLTSQKLKDVGKLLILEIYNTCIL